MITVKCHYDNSDMVVTGFNGTPQEARVYFIGNVFNVGSTTTDNMRKCIDIEVLYEIGQTVTFADGSEYVVERLYTLTPEEMKKDELSHANRVTMRKINGSPMSPETLDFAINGGV